MKKYDEIVSELRIKKEQLLELNNKKIRLEKDIIELQNSLQSFNLSKNTITLSENEKLDIFCSLFKGRTDVVPRRFESKRSGKSGYQPMCENEWRFGLCNKPKVKCSDCENRNLVPLSREIVRKHLIGKDEKNKDFTIGIYPLLIDETCWFLAVDFDKTSWKQDIKAFLTTCSKFNIPAYIEISRSGNGAHLWIFFSEPIQAKVARQMGSYFITLTMEEFSNISFDSYDRLFPNQDNMPKGGFGNLIALPLQANPRKNGYSVFVNKDFNVIQDQWTFLKDVKRATKEEVQSIVDKGQQTGKILGVKLYHDEDILPWELPPSRIIKNKLNTSQIPQELNIVIENQIYFQKDQLTPQFRNKLIRTAAFQNPEFYRAQAMRLPVNRIPRIISCSEEFSEHIGLPRGCADDISSLLLSYKIPFKINDKRNAGNKVESNFLGQLRTEQKKVVQKLLLFDIGVLSASTAFGKTVVALNIISKRKVNTLILVHRVQLLEQWKSRIETFLHFNGKVGTIGGGVNRPSNVIDIATIQSLCKKGTVSDIVGNYGFIIIDECHHISAFSFELVARQCKAKYFLGLSATLERKDGHQPIIFMQCGPVRYRVNDKQEALKRGFKHKVFVKETKLELPQELMNNDKMLQIQDVYSYIGNSEYRNNAIVKDVLQSISKGRSPVIITERKDHLDVLYEKLVDKVRNIFILKGGLRKKERQEIISSIKKIKEDEPRLIIATGKFLGEGFDDSRLDTLFLTMPVSWKGTLSQYAGRLHREHYSKKEVVIYDYVDNKIPVLNRMFRKRIKGYEAIGYKIEYSNMQQPELSDVVTDI